MTWEVKCVPLCPTIPYKGDFIMEQTGVKAFLKRKNVNITVKTYLIDAMGAMAFGLFASLLIGTIFGTLGDKTQVALFQTIAEYCKSATGAALGVSIAYALHAPQLVLFSAATVGIAGNALGGPVGALLATIVATELGKIVSKETRVDILVTPGVTIISGVLVAQFVGPGVSAFMTAFGNLVSRKCHYVGNRVAAVLYGNAGFCSYWNCADPSNQQRSHLYHAESGRSGRRRRHGRMLRTDDWLCCIELP